MFILSVCFGFVALESTPTRWACALPESDAVLLRCVLKTPRDLFSGLNSDKPVDSRIKSMSIFHL